MVKKQITMQQFLVKSRHLVWLIFMGLGFADILVLTKHFDWYIFLCFFTWWLVVKGFGLKSDFSITSALGCWLGVFLFTLLKLPLPAYKLSHWTFLFLNFGIIQLFFEEND